MSSIARSRAATRRPISTDATSRSNSRFSASSISRTIPSLRSSEIGRLPHAETIPRRTLSGLKGTRVPSRFTTTSRSVRS